MKNLNALLNATLIRNVCSIQKKKKKMWKLNVESYRKACITCILQYFNFGFVFFFAKLDGNSNAKYISIEDFSNNF